MTAIQEENKIKVKFIYPIYKNKTNGYCIYKYSALNNNIEDPDNVICKGYNLPDSKQLNYEMNGTWTDTPKGRNFVVTTYTQIAPESRTDIINYLSGKMFEGVGKKTAERIFEMFGSESLNIIRDKPDMLARVKGINLDKAIRISQSYNKNLAENNLVHEIAEFLLPAGISPNAAVKAVNILKLKDIESLKKNPYRLLIIKGITLEKVDIIAKKCGIPADSDERLAAHARNVLFNAALDGNTCVESKDFGYRLIESMACSSVNCSTVTDKVIALIKSGILRVRKTVYQGNTIQTISLKEMDNKEMECAIKLRKLSSFIQEQYNDYEEYIQDYCKRNDIVLDSIQKEAVIRSLRESVSIISGGPGMGKTTTIKLIASYLYDHGYGNDEVIFMAPSGRAARRITETTGFSASTLHSGLGLMPDNDNIQIDEDHTFENNETIIVDEFSMVDINLFHVLLDAISEGCRLIIVGDANQLQSVGPGAVLRDLIKSNVIPCTILQKVYRQSADSMIYINAKNIVSGIHDVKEGSDFEFIDSKTPEEAEQKMIDRYLELIGGNIENVSKVYCLCPLKDHSAGVNRMNALIQEKINPLSRTGTELSLAGQIYRPGDQVMHLENNDEVSNGDIGIVKEISVKDRIVRVQYNNIIYDYNDDNADALMLAYAFTVHKAQGSENDYILTYLSKSIGKKMLKRSLFNTAITRASVKVGVFTTNDNAINEAIDNNDSEYRLTHLCDYVKKEFGEFYI